jgi:glycosyltransferase involved in cell wall biosynthesis
MNEPAFSVVIPSYNTAATIVPTVRSVLAQTFSEFEVIVADDGSTDSTVDVVSSLADARVRVLDLDHRGAAAARNAGIAAARGRFVSFLDSDDLWLPRYLELMNATLERNPDAGFAFTDAWVVDAVTGRVRRTSVVRSPTAAAPPSDPGEFLTSLIRINFVFTSASVRRAVLERVGGFDETLPAGIDYELWLRIAAHGFRGVRAPGLLAVYRAGRAGSISSSQRRVVQGLIEVYRTVAERHPVSADDRRLALELLAGRQEELAALNGDRSPRSVWLRLYPRLARVKQVLLRQEGWYATPPSELVAAFPDLFGAPSPR